MRMRSNAEAVPPANMQNVTRLVLGHLHCTLEFRAGHIDLNFTASCGHLDTMLSIRACSPCLRMRAHAAMQLQSTMTRLQSHTCDKFSVRSISATVVCHNSTSCAVWASSRCVTVLQLAQNFLIRKAGL
jgi:hypothetical protein